MKIEWGTSLCVGIPEIDDGNRQIVQIYNHIHEHRNDNVAAESISFAVEKMREHASTHFRCEEKYMKSIGYPGYYAHKDEHKEFKEKTATLCIDVMNRKENVPKEIYNYLSAWIIHHILYADKEVKQFANTGKGEVKPHPVS